MKMFLQCHGCGFTECLDLGENDFDAQEKELNRVLDMGWRFASPWDGFVCPSCALAGGSSDSFFALAAGKPKIWGKLASYVELRDQAERLSHEMQTLG